MGVFSYAIIREKTLIIYIIIFRQLIPVNKKRTLQSSLHHHVYSLPYAFIIIGQRLYLMIHINAFYLFIPSSNISRKKSNIFGFDGDGPYKAAILKSLLITIVLGISTTL